MRLLRAATQRGVAGVVVTHEAQLASWADRVVFLRDGHVVDQTVAPAWPRVAPRGCRSAMTTLAHRLELRWPAKRRRRRPPRARSAGSWRMFRREWRQQLLVVTLLTVAVAAAIGSITVAYNAVPADDGEFGSANHAAQVRRLRSAKARGGPRLRQEVVRNDRRHRPPLGAPCPAASRRSTTGRRTPTAPTALSCSRSAAAATRRAAIRSPSPTESQSLCSSRSGRPWRSTGTDGPSWASSRTRAS